MRFMTRASSASSVTAPMPVELGETAHRGQRGAQLVARIGDEAPHPLLGGARVLLRALLGVEGVFDLAEHGVQRRAEPADLGVVVCDGDAAAQVAGGDGFGGALDLDEAPQAAAHQEVADPGEQQPARSR